MALSGMTGFAREEGAEGAWTWAVEARSVNGRNLEARFRGPPGFDALERAAREGAQARFQRGQITIGLQARRAETAGAVYGYVALVMLILLGCTAVVSIDGYDFSTNFTAALSCISNVGPGLGKIGPSGNFAIFSPLPKLVMAVTMLFGRLEVYAMLILFIPSTWKRR